MKEGKRILLSVGSLLASLPPAQAGTCALCREILRSGGNAGLIKGYYWSIVLIVAVPLVVIGLGWRYARRLY